LWAIAESAKDKKIERFLKVIGARFVHRIIINGYVSSHSSMSESPPPRTLIGPRTAFLLYALLAIIAWRVLHGKALTFVFILIGALALKSYLEYLRRKLH
jgi:hypothetical protein